MRFILYQYPATHNAREFIRQWTYISVWSTPHTFCIRFQMERSIPKHTQLCDLSTILVSLFGR